jgi:WD40 repeat protein
MIFDSTDAYLAFACKKSLGMLAVREPSPKLVMVEAGEQNNHSLLCLIAFPQMIVAGLQSGQLIAFSSNISMDAGGAKGPGGADKETAVYAFSHYLTDQHKGPCGAVCTSKFGKGFLSAGYDGSVIYWGSKPSFIKRYELQNDLKTKVGSIKIKSICEDPLGEEIIIGTRGGEIFEAVPNSKPATNILRGHLGELVGIERLGNKDEFVTVGKDKEMIIWDGDRQKEKKRASIPLEFEASAVASCGDGSHIAVGFLNGYLEVLDSGNAAIVKKMKDRSNPISVIKYASNGDKNFLAVGAEDFTVILYNKNDSYRIHLRFKGLQYVPRFIDFSQDTSVIKIVDDGFNLKYFDTAKDTKEGKDKKIQASSNFKDQKWATWSCPLGWEVYSLFDDKSLVRLLSCTCISPDKSVLAVGLKTGKIRFYKYPVVGNNPPYIEYQAHTSDVMNVIFINDKDKISDSAFECQFVSIGRRDRNVIQWRYARIGNNSEGESSPTGKFRTLEFTDKDEQYYSNLKGFRREKAKTDSEEQDRRKQEAFDNKAANMENWNSIPKRQVEAPDQNLELKHIYGCKYEGASDCVKFSSSGSVVYFAGNKAIVQDVTKETKPQTFFTLHRNLISAMDICKAKDLVATADLVNPEEHSEIYVWNCTNKMAQLKILSSGRGGVIKLKFSSEGSKLIAICNDEYHTMDVFDVSNGNLLTSVQTNKRPILDVAFKSDSEFVTTTSKGPRFWEIKGSNLVSTQCDWSNMKPKREEEGRIVEDSTVCCIYAFVQKICFTATAKGFVYTWQNNAFVKSTPGHEEKAVRVMVCEKNILYTGGDDGYIKTWSYSGKLTQVRQIELQIPEEKIRHFEIRSLDINSEGHYLLGTDTAKILLCNPQSKTPAEACKIVNETHASHSITALATHPMTAQFVTAADDGRIIKWDIASKTSIETSLTSDDGKIGRDFAVALDWSQNGEVIAAGSSKGILYLFDKSLSKKIDLAVSDKNEGLKQISVIKISPSGNVLAVGYSNMKIVDLYDFNEKGTNISFKSKKDNLSSTCRFMDWSDDGEFLSLTLDNFEVLKTPISNDGSKDAAPESFSKEKNWISWTQPLGLTVRGIKIDGAAIKYTPVCRSHKYVARAKDYETVIDGKQIRLLLASGDRFGNVNLYRYPSIYPDSECKSYNALMTPITAIRFLDNDNYVVAISDQDNSIVIFQSDFRYDEKVADNVEAVLANSQNAMLDMDSIENYQNNKVTVRLSRRNAKAGQLEVMEPSPDDRDLARLYNDTQGLNEKNRFSRPWLASIRYPTDYLKPDINSTLAPKLRISPNYVFGFRTKDCRDNLKYLNSEEIMFATGALVVIHNLRSNRQRFFSEHMADVSCFSLKSGSNFAASGEVGMNPLICIWSTDSLSSIKKIKAVGMEGIAKVQFNPNSNLIAVLGTDKNSTIAIFNFLSGVQLHSVLGDGPGLRIMDLKWLATDEFTTVGINHIKYWKLENNQLKDTRGKLDPKRGQQHIVCCAVNKKDVIAGTINGDVLIWKRGLGNDIPQTNSDLSAKKAEKCGCVDCIVVTEQK